jgi:hypothetical protein
MKLPKRSWALFGTLDRYVGRLFLGAYVVALLLVVGLYLVVDLASNLDDYLRPTESGESAAVRVARYYLLHLPFLYLSVAPFVHRRASAAGTRGRRCALGWSEHATSSLAAVRRGELDRGPDGGPTRDGRGPDRFRARRAALSAGGADRRGRARARAPQGRGG